MFKNGRVTQRSTSEKFSFLVSVLFLTQLYSNKKSYEEDFDSVNFYKIGAGEKKLLSTKRVRLNLSKLYVARSEAEWTMEMPSTITGLNMSALKISPN